MIPARLSDNPKLARIGTLLALAAMVLFHGLNNWRWLATNVTMLGWDVPSHLGTSYVYDSILRPLGPKSLFAAVVWHPNRPPLYFLSAVPLYRLFGISPDVATMVNVFYLALLFGSVYAIGRRLGGRPVGLLAAFVIATMPMIYAISRYFYLELALTALVALSVYLLLASQGFENRLASLLFGISFGLGLLTKRTYLVFVLAPLCLVVVRSQAVQSLRQRLRAGQWIDVKGLLVALAIGLVLALAWYLPAREIAAQLPLAGWLVPLWTLLLAGTVYLARLEPRPDTNLLSALFLGASLGSLWYLPRITFIERVLRFGFGVNDPWERTAGLDRATTYVYFLARLVAEHVSPVYFLLFLIAVGSLVAVLVRKGQLGATLRRASDAWWVTVLWGVGAYLLLTLSIYRKSRGITPILPALALILAAGLFRLPWKNVVRALVAFIVAWGLVQFFVLSYEGPSRLADQTSLALPVLGEAGLFARGGTHQLPDEGVTDRGYWVVPDVLQMADSERQAAGLGSVKMGVLVNNDHANPDLFGLWALQSYPAIQVDNLARTGSPDSIHPRLFEYDYLVMVERDYRWIDEAAQEALRRLEEAPELFEAAFDLAGRFPRPDGDAILLYRKAWQPDTGYNLQDYSEAAEAIDALAQEGDALLLVPADQIEAVGRTYSGRLAVYLLGGRTSPLHSPQHQPLDEAEMASALAGIAARHPMLFALFGQAGSEQDTSLPPVENRLNEHIYRGPTEWYGSSRLVIYGAPADDGASTPSDESPERVLDAALGDQIRLQGYSLVDREVEPGRMLLLTLFWQAGGMAGEAGDEGGAEGPVAERYTVFAHLLDEDGQLVAQQDSEPVGGSRPTTSWSPGEVIEDRLGILIPPDLDGGEYQLVVGMYRPDTGERLPVRDVGDGMSDDTIAGDSIALDKIQVR
jgi:4-amino-4-deoxy-L-arabinose transferase-like glycosyltransferase